MWTVFSSSRLDSFLASSLECSRTHAKELIEGGAVEVNDKQVTKPSYALQENDTVACHQKPTTNNQQLPITPVNQHLPILHEDPSSFVLNKPAGLAVHPGSGMSENEETLLSGIAFLYEERSLPFSPDSVLVHRLDKETTGCILVAKNAEAHSQLQKQFEDRTVKKQYLALVAGIPENTKAMIDSPIGRNLTDRTKMSVLRTSVSREAQTSYEVLQSSDDTSLLLCDLHTGRTHQVRVHLSSIGHPILGDLVYSSSVSEKLTEEYEVQGLCLHAWKLEFVTPHDSAVVQVEAPLSDVLQDAVRETIGTNYSLC